MAVLMRDGGEESRRDYPSLYIELCCCAGPQPSLSNPRADEHAHDCPYRIEVEPNGNSGERRR